MMMNAALSERNYQQAVSLNVTENESAEQKSSKSPLRRWKAHLRKPHFIDLTIFIIVIAVIVTIEYGIIPSGQLGFICKDPKLSFPFRGDTISATVLLVTATFGPIFILVLVEVLREQSFKKIRVGVVWHYYKECLIGSILVLLITEVMKCILGEHRPHFFDTCEPDVMRFCSHGDFITEYNCTNTGLTRYTRSDVGKSFPSGHTSISLFVGIYCSYLIQTRIRTYQVSLFTKPFLIAVCLSWSMLCSLSRITDRRHHWWDVLGGAALGSCGAIYTLVLLRKKDQLNELVMSGTSTTLLDVKNKQSQSVVI